MMGWLYGDTPWSLLGLQIHMVFATAVFIGLIFLVVYAIKFMKKDTLKTWLMWLLIIGLIGSLLTCGLGWRGFKSGNDGFRPGWMMQWTNGATPAVSTGVTEVE